MNSFLEGNRIPLAGLATGGIAVAAMWLPWFRSGSAGRNSFAAFRAAQLLGIDWITPLRVFWFLLPVFFLVATAAWLFRARRTSAVVLLFLSAFLGLAGGFAALVLGLQSGSVTTTVAAVGATVLAVLTLR